MRTAPALTLVPGKLAASAVASALARTRRSHRASGRASTRRLAAPQRRTLVLGQQRRLAMNTTTVRTRFVPVLALLVFALSAATSSALACVVGTGTSASCTGAALDACLPGGASFDGTVTFACGGAATITLGSRKIISADTTIDGGGVITISGPLNTGPGGTGFSLTSSGVTFTVENLTIANGRALVGGAINNMRGTLIVTNSTFSGNSSPNGGAIVNGAIGTLIVTNSNFSGNHGTFGGGAILNGGTATVTNSSFSANSSSTAGGAISNLNFLIVT